MQDATPTPPTNSKPKPTGSGVNMPTNYRRKRRHSEPHLTVTKPYKNFVTHWKLDTKKPILTPSQTSPTLSTEPYDSPTSSSNSNNTTGNNNNWSPSTSGAMRTMFHPYKKDNSPSFPTSHHSGQVKREGPRRRSSLPHIYDSETLHNSHNSTPSGIAHSAIMEEDEGEPELTFPPSPHEYRFPPIMLNFPPPPHDDLLFRSKERLTPIRKGTSKVATEKPPLPSLRTLLQDVRGVSLGDGTNGSFSTIQESSADDNLPRGYVVRRKMSIDNLLQ